jgi:hypothetical protein
VVEELTNQIAETETNAIEDTIRVLLPEADGDARKHELENALRIDLGRLYELIDHGLTIEIRATEPVAAEVENTPGLKEQYVEIKRIADMLRFPPIQGSPIHQLSPPPPNTDDAGENVPDRAKHPGKGKKPPQPKH